MSSASPSTSNVKFAALLTPTLAFHLLAGCCLNHVPKHPGCDLQQTPQQTIMDIACSTATCGSNSPYVNAFPFNGLNSDGCINADGYALDKTGFAPGLECKRLSGSTPLYLGYEPIGGAPNPAQPTGWQLAAKKQADDTPVCTGPQLAGSSFRVISRDDTTTLRISHVATAPVSYLQKTDIDLIKACKDACSDEMCRARCEYVPPKEQRFVYLIANQDNPSRSLCTRFSRRNRKHLDAVEPTSVSQISNIFTEPQLWEVEKEELGGYATIIPGPIYTDYGETIVYTSGSEGARTRQWFNIACAGDGLGQSDLAGVVAPTDADPGHRQAAIRMFTAQYDGGISATVGGMPIAWETYPSKGSNYRFSIELLPRRLIRPAETDMSFSIEALSGQSQSESNPKDQMLPEAAWDAQGALAVFHSRLWMSNRVIPLPPDIKRMYSGYLNSHHIDSEEAFTHMICEIPVSTSETITAKSAAHFDNGTLARTPVLRTWVRGHISHGSSVAPWPKPCLLPGLSSAAVAGT